MSILQKNTLLNTFLRTTLLLYTVPLMQLTRNAVSERICFRKNTHVFQKHTCVLLNTHVFLFVNYLIVSQLVPFFGQEDQRWARDPPESWSQRSPSIFESQSQSWKKGLEFWKSRSQSRKRDWNFESLNPSLKKGLGFQKSQYHSWKKDDDYENLNPFLIAETQSCSSPNQSKAKQINFIQTESSQPCQAPSPPCHWIIESPSPPSPPANRRTGAKWIHQARPGQG